MQKLLIHSCCFFLLIFSNIVSAEDAPVTFSFSNLSKFNRSLLICIDNNFWFPYTFTTKNKPVGLYPDIIQAAIAKAGYEAEYFTKPWEDCVTEIKNGTMDALLSLAYTPERENYIFFPEDAAWEAISTDRITQVNYFVITPLKNNADKLLNYKFNGDLTSLPRPIRLAKNSCLTQLFKDNGVPVQEYASNLQMYKNLLSTKQGSLISTKDMWQFLNKQHVKFKNLFLHNKIIASRSFFLGFGKEANVPRKVRRKVWQAISDIRGDRSFTDELLSRYNLN